MVDWITHMTARIREKFNTQYTAHAERVLKNAGIITSPLEPPHWIPDEPRFIAYSGKLHHDTSGGLSISSHEDAKRACLAEALERHLWSTDTSLITPVIETYTSGISRGRELLDPYILVEEETGKKTNLHDLETPWISTYDHTTQKTIWVPAQYIFAAARGIKTASNIPLFTTTTGLATHTSKTACLLGGMLECIERDAFMMLWRTRYTPERIDHSEITTPALIEFLKKIEKYGLMAHVSLLKTDAPTYVVLVSVEDTRACALQTPMPYITVGAAAHQSFERAIEKALLEALRARTNARRRFTQTPSLIDKSPRTLVHTERGVYWMNQARAQTHLTFLKEGNTRTLQKEPWHNETDAQHLARLYTWTRSKKYRVLTFDLTYAQGNPLSWYVTMTRMPDLQPMWMHESHRVYSHDRMRAFSASFNISEHPDTESPHPFV